MDNRCLADLTPGRWTGLKGGKDYCDYTVTSLADGRVEERRKGVTTTLRSAEALVATDFPHPAQSGHQKHSCFSCSGRTRRGVFSFLRHMARMI